MTEGHSSDSKKRSQRVMRSDGERRGGWKKRLLGERTSENDKDKKRKRERERTRGRYRGRAAESLWGEILSQLLF